METPVKNLKKDLAQILVESGLIAEEQLQRVMELQRKTGDKFERILLQQRLITPQQLAFLPACNWGSPSSILRKKGLNPMR